MKVSKDLRNFIESYTNLRINRGLANFTNFYTDFGVDVDLSNFTKFYGTLKPNMGLTFVYQMLHKFGDQQNLTGCIQI